jgi:hypothetical protein
MTLFDQAPTLPKLLQLASERTKAKAMASETKEVRVR